MRCDNHRVASTMCSLKLRSPDQNPNSAHTAGDSGYPGNRITPGKGTK